VPLTVVLMSVLGGTRSWAGPAIGATAITILLYATAVADQPVAGTAAVGAVLVAAILLMPEGILGRVFTRRSPGAPPALPVAAVPVRTDAGVAAIESPPAERERKVLLAVRGVAKSFKGVRALDGIDLDVREGEVLGVIGPNGSGKSTLLRILAGVETPDSGSTAVRKMAKLGYVPQDVVFPPAISVQQIMQEAAPSEEGAARIPAALGQAGFENGDALAASLSGGWKRRLAIARELVREPDILLLDEPTNHLDLAGILWLENLLKAAPFASVVVSHDRYFLENVATDMIELAKLYPGGLFRVKGGYSDFLARKDEFISAQDREQQSLKNQVRRELEWLRRGPKARTTKSKARIDAAGRLIGELAEISARRETGSAQIDFNASGRRTKNLLEARGLSKQIGGRALFRNLDLILRPGVRLGLVGANGSGKTTLLRILNGEIAADAGTVERADALRVVYFDQNRRQLDPAVSLRKALRPTAIR
jgi:ATPase components of ABC transporters with duplicated ATPase domains